MSDQLQSIKERVHTASEQGEIIRTQIFLADQNILVDLDLNVFPCDDINVIRSSALGLAAYGSTDIELTDNFINLMKRFADAHYKQGNLETVLIKAEVNWRYQANDDASCN